MALRTQLSQVIHASGLQLQEHTDTTEVFLGTQNGDGPKYYCVTLETLFVVLSDFAARVLSKWWSCFVWSILFIYTSLLYSSGLKHQHSNTTSSQVQPHLCLSKPLIKQTDKQHNMLIFKIWNLFKETDKQSNITHISSAALSILGLIHSSGSAPSSSS